jgi:hypothetical protein
VVPLPSGERGIKVLLTCEAHLNATSFRETCRLLRDAFATLAGRHAGVAVDMDTLAVATRSVKATLPADRFDELVSLLDHEHCHVRVRVARQAVGQGRCP